jgi:hypothetical protein
MIEFEDLGEVMRSIESSCKSSLKRKLVQNNIFDTTFLMNFEICSERMKQGKSSYLSFQYHFKQKNNENQSILSIKENNEDFFIGLLNEMEEYLQKHQICLNRKRGI